MWTTQEHRLRQAPRRRSAMSSARCRKSLDRQSKFLPKGERGAWTFVWSTRGLICTSRQNYYLIFQSLIMDTSFFPSQGSL